MEIDAKTLKKFIPFHSLSSAHLTEVQRGVRSQPIARGHSILKNSEPSKQCFYLLSGSIDFRDSENKKIDTVTADTDQARHALHNFMQKADSATAGNSCTVLSIDKNYLDLVLTWDQAGEYVVDDISGGDKTKAKNTTDWMSALLESPLFTQIPAANIQQLFTKFENVPVKNGQTIIKEGEVGDYFYVIAQGDATVIRHMGSAEQELLAEISTGDFFGEDALISDAPRNATVIMASPGVLQRLNKADFTNLLHMPLQNYISSAQLETLLQNPNYKSQVLDVRLSIEYKLEHRAGSINLPLPSLRKKLPSLDIDTIYITLCDGGRRAEVAAHVLSQAGLNAYILKDA